MSIVYRYSVSALSRHNYKNALPEEILIEKDTGQILLKTKAGNIISYDYNTRLQGSISNITNTAEKKCLIGKIYSVDLVNTDLPSKIEHGVNILLDDSISLGNIKRFILQIDLDIISKDSKFGDIIDMEDINVSLSVSKNESPIKTLEKNINSFNEHVFIFESSDCVIDNLSVTFKDNEKYKNVDIILHDILLMSLS